MEEPKYCFIQFKLSYKAEANEEIRVVGSIPELGNWDVKKAEKMVTSKLDYPVWKTKENIKIRQNTELQYKYIILIDSKFSRWEGLPNNANRTLNVKNMVRIVIWDSQDSYGSKIEKFTKYNVSVESPSSSCVDKLAALDRDEPDNKFDIPTPRRRASMEGYPFAVQITPRRRASMEGSPFLVQKFRRDSFALKPQNEEEKNDEYKDLAYNSDEEIESIPQTVEEKTYVEVNDKDHVIMVSLYLPFRAVKTSNGEWDIILTNEPLNSTLWQISNKENVKWIGMLKNYFEIESEGDRNRLISILQKKYNMYVIHINEDSFNKLNYLINGIFEPMFHYITLTKKINSSFLDFEEYWKAFKEFNEITTREIMNHINEQSLIFLHDYHFFLVPSLIYSFCDHFNQRIIQKISIGLFIHSAFPSHDVFKRFPYREEILKAMLNCSIIGFHTFDCSRNFLKCVKRILLLNYESTIHGDLALNYYGRDLIIRVKNVTAEPELVEKATFTDEFKEIYGEITKKHEGKYIFTSLDNIDFLAGIMHKLEGYRRFLREIGDNFRQIVFLQYISFSFNEMCISDDLVVNQAKCQNEMLKRIAELGENIKKEFGSGVLEIIEKEVTYIERLAILAATKCIVRTCKRESYSLGIYEFLTLKILLKDECEVGYILSELSGVNTNLSGTIKINPFDFRSIQKGFLEAFQLYFDHVRSSITKEKDFLHVRKHTASEWLNSFLRDMKNAKENDENAYYIGAGTGLNFRLMKIHSNFKELNKKLIVENYDKAKRRLIFLDYEGTLPPAIYKDDEYQSKGQKPHEKTIFLLQQLTQDKRNTVFIVSGREGKLVSSWFSCVPDLGLACEHGFMYRYSSIENSLDKWDQMIVDFNNDWRGYCVEMLDPYTERCEGSLIEVKEASVVWQYRDCDPELGKSFANVVTQDLENSLKNLNLNVINGKGYVEVIAKGVNKGTFVSFIIKEEIKKNRTPDFILAIGDDTTDEEMFKYLNKKRSAIKKYAKKLKVHTITVGKKPSGAESYVNSPIEVTNVIESFAQINYKKRFSVSVHDIRGVTNDTSTIDYSISSLEKITSDELNN